MRIKQKFSGFTLIELLVVISIIGLLAAVILVSLSSARQKSRDAKRLADARQIQTALEIYFNDNGGYPIMVATVIHNLGLGSTSGWAATPTGTIYITKVNAAPLPADGSCTDALGSNRYTYTAAAATTYTVTFCLGAATGGYSAGVRTAAPGGIS